MANLLRQTEPIAQKEHCCQLCDLPIAPGQKYVRQTLVGDDGLYDFVMHEICKKACPSYFDDYDEWWVEDHADFRRFLFLEEFEKNEDRR